MLKWLVKAWLAKNDVLELAEAVKLALADKTISDAEARKVANELIDVLTKLELLK